MNRPTRYATAAILVTGCVTNAVGAAEKQLFLKPAGPNDKSIPAIVFGTATNSAAVSGPSLVGVSDVFYVQINPPHGPWAPLCGGVWELARAGEAQQEKPRSFRVI